MEELFLSLLGARQGLGAMDQQQIHRPPALPPSTCHPGGQRADEIFGELGDRGHGHASFAALIRATDRGEYGPTGRRVATPEVHGVVLGFLCTDQLFARLEHDRRETLQIRQAGPSRQLGEGTHPLLNGLE